MGRFVELVQQPTATGQRRDHTTGSQPHATRPTIPAPAGLAATPHPYSAAFLIIGASIAHQFEFLQRAWVNDGDLVGLGTNKYPLIGANDGTGTSTTRANRPAGG